jgi:hypothetical protein
VCVAPAAASAAGSWEGYFNLNLMTRDEVSAHEVSARRPHKNQSKLMVVKQVKIPGIQHQGGDSTFFLRESGLSSGTQNHAKSSNF